MINPVDKLLTKKKFYLRFTLFKAKKTIQHRSYKKKKANKRGHSFHPFTPTPFVKERRLSQNKGYKKVNKMGTVAKSDDGPKKRVMGNFTNGKSPKTNL